MTRRLRPPVSVGVVCDPDQGRPVRLRRGGRDRPITRITASWVQPAPWWEMGMPQHERTYYRIVVDHYVVYEIYCTGTDWFLERIVD